MTFIYRDNDLNRIKTLQAKVANRIAELGDPTEANKEERTRLLALQIQLGQNYDATRKVYQAYIGIAVCFLIGFALVLNPWAGSALLTSIAIGFVLATVAWYTYQWAEGLYDKYVTTPRQNHLALANALQGLELPGLDDTRTTDEGSSPRSDGSENGTDEQHHDFEDDDQARLLPESSSSSSSPGMSSGMRRNTLHGKSSKRSDSSSGSLPPKEQRSGFSFGCCRQDDAA